MSLAFPADTGPSIEPCPQGTHIARCYRFVDLGTQNNEYMGQVKRQRMVMFTWEIPSKRRVFTDKDGVEHDLPYAISKRYTWSMFEKATLRRHMESWRGKGFTDDELNSGLVTPKSFLGEACMVNVMHKVSQANGNTYAKLENVLPLMDGMECPPAENPTFYLDLTPEGFSVDKFEQLHEKTREQIAGSPEFKGLGDPSLSDDGSAGNAGQPSPQGQYDERNPPPITDFPDYATASGAS